MKEKKEDDSNNIGVKIHHLFNYIRPVEHE